MNKSFDDVIILKHIEVRTCKSLIEKLDKGE